MSKLRTRQPEVTTVPYTPDGTNDKAFLRLVCRYALWHNHLIENPRVNPAYANASDSYRADIVIRLAPFSPWPRVAKKLAALIGVANGFTVRTIRRRRSGKFGKQLRIAVAALRLVRFGGEISVVRTPEPLAATTPPDDDFERLASVFGAAIEVSKKMDKDMFAGRGGRRGKRRSR